MARKMKKRKLAVFVHGWSRQGKQWERRKQRLLLLFESLGYEIKTLDMPGKYMTPKKGFVDYAKFIAKEIKKIDDASICSCCYQDWPIDEIALIAHSMGGIACRSYLQDDKIGDVATKRKITKLITLASPHHGTSVAVEDAVEEILNFLTAGFLGEFENFHNSKCYKQLSPGSDFIRELNELPFPSTTKSHSIWARGDLVVTPTHSAVSDLANNYFIDRLRVHHIGVMHSAFTSDIVRDILNGNAHTNGLQKYPAKCNCESDKKQWVPVFYYSEESDEGCKSMKKEYLWKCKNVFEGKKCNEEHIQQWKPGLFGCEIGKMEQRLHTWRKTGLKHWTCKKCGELCTDKKHPEKYDRNGCVKPWNDWHRWHLVWYEWECINGSDDEKCGKKVKSRWRPPLAGCPVGKITGDRRWHDWYKADKKYLFKFQCTGCGKVVTLRE